jgi:hypothetical protein
MIISHKHKFIFIKTRKTAGTSIEIALSSLCGDKDIITPITPEDELLRFEMTKKTPQNYFLDKKFHSRAEWYLGYIGKPRKMFYNHIPALSIKKYVDKNVWDNYFKFCFERNPYDKVISAYNYLGGDKEFSNVSNFIDKGFLNTCIDFEKYTIGGKLVVDKICQFSNIQEDFNEVLKILKIDAQINLKDYKAKTNFKTDKRKYSEILNEEDRKIIELAFAREIKLFEYEF